MSYQVHLKSQTKYLTKVEKSSKIGQEKKGLISSDCNGIRSHNHLIRKRTLNHLAKLAI